MKNKLKLISVTSFFILVMVFSMSSSLIATNARTNDALDDIKTADKLTVGSDTAYAPFESIDETTGDAEGFDIDLANFIGDELGVATVEIITSAWDPIIPNLQGGQFDIIISAMTITAEREQEVDFSRWYYKSSQAVLVEDSNTDITSVDDLNAAGVKVGMQSGTTSQFYAEDHLTKATILTYNDVPTAIAALKLGTVDAVLGDYDVLALDSTSSGKTKVVDTFSPEDFGIAVRSGETALLDAINAALEKLLGTDLDNPVHSEKYKEMYETWFEVEPPNYNPPAAPGFEFVAIFSIALVPIVRKFKK